MKKIVCIFISVFLVCITLAGCDGFVSKTNAPVGKAQPGQEAPAVPERTKKEFSKEELAAIKLDGYVDVFNSLTNEDSGLSEVYRTYMRTVVKANMKDTIVFPVVANLDSTQDALRQSRAIAVEDLSELDMMADPLFAACEKILAYEKDLVPYFRDEEYRKDKMAKARSVLPILQKDYEDTLNLLSHFGEQIMKEKRMLAEKRMERFSGQGDMVRYHSEEMVMLAEELLAIFDDPKIPFNRTSAFSQGNVIIVKLDNAIKAQRKVVDDFKFRNQEVSPYYDDLRNGVAGIINDYREVRDKKSQPAFERMLKKYDRAIQDFNSAQI